MTTRIQNLYVARLTTQERPCFVCSKFTNVVLTSADNSNDDWFYTCRTHLGDFNFCSKVGGSPTPKASTTSSPRIPASLKERPAESDSVVDLVSSIGSALTSWRKKGDDDKNEDKEKDGDKNKEKEKEKADTKKKDSAPSSPTTSTSPSPRVPAPQLPPKFILQRDYFYLRQREHFQKHQRMEAQAKLKVLDFPEVPKVLPSAKQ